MLLSAEQLYPIMHRVRKRAPSARLLFASRDVGYYFDPAIALASDAISLPPDPRMIERHGKVERPSACHV
ncbi:hypothetical protein HYQ44_012530 [Verticillium longisporum]|nr:hypothetical protein HYQ44_012530 [Verticillium longisporum]